MLGCTKIDLFRWGQNPCSTHLTSRNAKRAVVKRAGEVFGLTCREQEELIRRAGLSLREQDFEMEELVRLYGGKPSELQKKAGISERMMAYYLAGKKPTKQALLAILIVMEFSAVQTDDILTRCGYCLSKSLANDMVVLWFLEKQRYGSGRERLEAVNDVLADMDLPLLMTKQIDR